MNKVALTRWALFLLLGIPFQIVVYSIYPILWLIWRVFVFRPQEPKLTPKHWEPSDFQIGRKTKINGALLDNDDDHGALTQYGFVGPVGLGLLLDEEGNFLRAIDKDGVENKRKVSGDCVISWAFAYSLLKEDRQPYDLALKAAENYFKNLGTLSFDDENKGWVSARCNNFGANFCKDGPLKFFGQPMAGPQFYTNSCLFAIASQKSAKFKFIFWAHWILLGGWFWAFWPSLYPKDGLWYVRDMCMKSLWVHKQVFGNKWWIELPMKMINNTVNYKNPLFEAMLETELMPLPDVVHAFFSQAENSSSSEKLYKGNKRASAYIKGAIRKIYFGN